MLYNAWPETLELLFRKSGLSQAQLAARMGKAEQTVSRWLLRKSKPRDRHFEDIAGAFLCSAQSLGKVYSRLLANHYWQAGDETMTFDAPTHTRRRTVVERADALLHLDLGGTAPEMRAVLRAHRSSLRNLVSQFCGQADVLVTEFEQLLEAAGRRP